MSHGAHTDPGPAGNGTAPVAPAPGPVASDALIVAFVQGAQWWEHHRTGHTMWQSDRDMTEARAEDLRAAGALGKLPNAALCDPAEDAAAPGSVQPAGSATYRLLGWEDSICIGDEFLRDDCETWEMVSTSNCTFVGERYDGKFLVPMRRRLPNDATQRPGSPDGSLATESRKPGSRK